MRKVKRKRILWRHQRKLDANWTPQLIASPGWHGAGGRQEDGHCGTDLLIGSGVVENAGPHSFQFTAEHPGSYSLTITVKDGQSRFAATEVKVVMN